MQFFLPHMVYTSGNHNNFGGDLPTSHWGHVINEYASDDEHMNTFSFLFVADVATTTDYDASGSGVEETSDSAYTVTVTVCTVFYPGTT